MGFKKATLGIFERQTDGRILLGRKLTGEIGVDTFNGPGGKNRPGENPRACLRRETVEELVMMVKPDDLHHVACLMTYLNDREFMQVDVFRCNRWYTEPRATDVMVPHWFPKTEIPFDRMLPSDAIWLPRILAGERFAAKIYFGDTVETFKSIEYFPY